MVKKQVAMYIQPDFFESKEPEKQKGMTIIEAIIIVLPKLGKRFPGIHSPLYNKSLTGQVKMQPGMADKGDGTIKREFRKLRKRPEYAHISVWDWRKGIYQQ